VVQEPAQKKNQSFWSIEAGIPVHIFYTAFFPENLPPDINRSSALADKQRRIFWDERIL
jgi:hypothetical protein